MSARAATGNITTLSEEWRAVVGWGGFYEVSDLGRVRSLARKNVRQTKIVRGGTTEAGYRTHVLSNDGERLTRYAHHLVLEAFVGPCPPDYETRHIDNDSLNNRLGNLKWGTSAENKRDMLLRGTRPIGSRQGNARLDEGSALEVKRALAAQESPTKIAARFGVSYGAIQAVLDDRTWRHVSWPPGYVRLPRAKGPRPKH